MNRIHKRLLLDARSVELTVPSNFFSILVLLKALIIKKLGNELSRANLQSLISGDDQGGVLTVYPQIRWNGSPLISSLELICDILKGSLHRRVQKDASLPCLQSLSHPRQRDAHFIGLLPRVDVLRQCDPGLEGRRFWGLQVLQAGPDPHQQMRDDRGVIPFDIEVHTVFFLRIEAEIIASGNEAWVEVSKWKRRPLRRIFHFVSLRILFLVQVLSHP